MEKIITGTPYDDVFRTLLNDCTSLIIPVVNELFGEHFTGNETIESACLSMIPRLPWMTVSLQRIS